MSQTLIIITVLLPIVGGVLLAALPIKKREHGIALSQCMVTVTSVLVWLLLLKGPTKVIHLVRFVGDLSISFKLDGLGMVFAGLISLLWPLAILYAYEYMSEFPYERYFFLFYTMTYGITLGLCFASDMLTMYFFYELLTLSTVPLVLFALNRESVLASRKYLYYSIGGAAFALTGMIFVIVYGSTCEFTPGGIFTPEVIAEHGDLLLWIYLLSFMGFGVKSAIWPVSSWLPQAGVAPTPVTALLHAVAVVNAGAFAIIRLTYYCFGTDMLFGSWVQNLCMGIAAFTIAYGCSRAVKDTHLKRRLAWSTVSNLSYIIFGAVLMTPAGLTGALCHFVFHGFMKMCSFLCVGSVMHQTGKNYVFETDGMGKYMKVTFACFTLSALGLMGVPGFSGFISKWHLTLAAADVGTPIALIGICALLISALLTGIYMFGIVCRAYFPKDGFDTAAVSQYKDPGLQMKLPVMICAAATLLLGLFSSPLVAFFKDVAAGLY